MKRKLLNLVGIATLLLCSSNLLGQTYNVWTGAVDTDWHTAGNWDLGTVPVATDFVEIYNETNAPVISSSTTVVIAELYIDSGGRRDGGSLTINSGSSLTITGDYINDFECIINSDSASSAGSLVVNGDVIGDLTYNRHVPGGAWYLISAPVGDQNSQSWVADNPGLFLTSASNNVAIANYQNSGWEYTSGVFGFNVSGGVGASVRLQSSGVIPMTGTMQGATVIRSLVSSGDYFNLLGNPYPSYMNSGTFLEDNTTQLSEETIWIRTSGTTYAAQNRATSYILAPGQGFFARANLSTSSSSVTFSSSYQSHGSGALKVVPSANYELSVELGGVKKTSKVFYIENKTTGFDNGYDSSLFSDSGDFSIYTELVTDGEGQKLEIQTLPDENIESFVVPVGVKAVADSEITFSIETSNFDENLKLYLEDRVSNTFTRLDEVNSMYKVTPETDLDGVGRFYVHASQTALSVDTNEWLSTVQIYKLNNASVRITGLTQGNSSVRMYNVMGKEVLSTSFNAAGAKDITLPNNISKGVYFVKLETADGILNKKIIVE